MVQTRGKPPANADGPTMTVTTSTSTYTKSTKRGDDGVKYRRERVDEVPVKNTTNQPPAAIEQPPSRPQFASVQPPVLFAPPVLHSYSSMSSSKSTINNHNPAQVVVTGAFVDVVEVSVVVVASVGVVVATWPTVDALG